MKNNIIVVLLLFLFTQCKENENIGKYNNADSYIYFGYLNSDIHATEKFMDSIHYSFALDNNPDRQDITIDIPVNIGGLAINSERKYSFVVSPTSEFNPDIVQISEPIIRSGRYIDSLSVTIQKADELMTKKMKIVLELRPNNNFQLGNYYNRQFKISFDNILEKPEWWDIWDDYFGPYYKEVFQQWMRIYYLGLDPTPDYYGSSSGPYYYWYRMPDFTSERIFPVTMMMIERLKKYFEDNVVHPNNNPNQERILLP